MQINSVGYNYGYSNQKVQKNNQPSFTANPSRDFKSELISFFNCFFGDSEFNYNRIMKLLNSEDKVRSFAEAFRKITVNTGNSQVEPTVSMAIIDRYNYRLYAKLPDSKKKEKVLVREMDSLESDNVLNLLLANIRGLARRLDTGTNPAEIKEATTLEKIRTDIRFTPSDTIEAGVENLMKYLRKPRKPRKPKSNA